MGHTTVKIMCVSQEINSSLNFIKKVRYLREIKIETIDNEFI